MVEVEVEVEVGGEVEVEIVVAEAKAEGGVEDGGESWAGVGFALAACFSQNACAELAVALPCILRDVSPTMVTALCLHRQRWLSGCSRRWLHRPLRLQHSRRLHGSMLSPTPCVLYWSDPASSFFFWRHLTILDSSFSWWC